MPTVIDELIVQIGLDSSKFKTQSDQAQASIKQTGDSAVKNSKNLEEQLRKTQQETQKRFKQTEDVAKQSSVSFGKFKNEVVGLFAILSTGFGLQQFIKNITNTDASTGRLAASIGISTQGLNKWQEAAKRTGGSAEATGSSLLNLTREYQKFSTGQGSSILPFLRTLKVAWSDANGAMRPMEDILQDLHKAVQGMDKPRADMLLGGLGLDQGTINLLEQTDAGMKELLTTAEKLGLINQKDADVAIAYQNSLTGLEQAFTTLGRTILADGLGPFTQFVNEITAWISDPKNAKLIEDTAITGMKAFGDTLNTVVGFIKEFHSTAELLAAFIAGRWVMAMTIGTGPVGILVASLAALAASLNQAQKFFDPEQWSNNSVFWSGMSEADQLTHANSPASRKARGEPEVDPNSVNWKDPSSWLTGHAGGGVNQGLDATDDKKLMYRDRLAADLGISKEAAAGVIGNANYESGLQGINEKNPLVPGSRGGFGWAQWTGDRRTNFENYARGRGLDVTSDEANYGFLQEELKTKYPQILAQLQRHDITATEAADLVLRKYEAPADPDKSAAWRATSAVHISHLGGSQGAPVAATQGPSAYMNSLNRAEANPWEAKRAAANQNATTNNNSETNIGAVNVTLPNATDSDGIARGIGASLKKFQYVPQANTGLN